MEECEPLIQKGQLPLCYPFNAEEHDLSAKQKSPKEILQFMPLSLVIFHSLAHLLTQGPINL